MTDKFNIEITENCFVAQVNKAETMIGVARGGFTNTGVRVLDLVHTRMKVAKPSTLVRLTNSQALGLAGKLREEHNEKLQNYLQREGNVHPNIQANYETELSNLDVVIRVMQQGGDGNQLTVHKRI